MLQIIIPGEESFDERTNTFIAFGETKLTLEHSLIALSKWEAKHCKPFLTDTEKTQEEIIDYVRCMTIGQEPDQSVYDRLTNENISEIQAYIESPMTATWFSDDKKGGRGSEQVTSELIYYWMVAFNIPSEYQKWHLNRLMTLIRVCNAKNQPQKKMSRSETANRYRALNAKRRKKR